MNIKKENDNLIVTIPLKQKIHNPYDEDETGECDNLVGICAGDEFTINQSIDMSYKGKAPQEGMPILHFTTREELEEVCGKYNIQIWEHEICGFCKKVIYGTSTYKDGKNQCYDCEWKEKI